MTSDIESEIRIEPRKAEDGQTYWSASAVGVSGVVGGGDTPEEALAELQENYDVLFSRDKLLSRGSVLRIIGKNKKRMDSQCYYDMLDDVFNMSEPEGIYLVVHCRNCVYRGEDGGRSFCKLYGINCEIDDPEEHFCSDGRRIE